MYPREVFYRIVKFKAGTIAAETAEKSMSKKSNLFYSLSFYRNFWATVHDDLRALKNPVWWYPYWQFLLSISYICSLLLSVTLTGQLHLNCK
jgi:hypothetical protein